MDIDELLARRLGISDIRVIASRISEDVNLRDKFHQFLYSSDRRIAINTLWALTNIDSSDTSLINHLHDELVEILLKEEDPTKKRLILQILRSKRYKAEDIRTDLLDYCYSKINAECEPYAVRCYSLYIAFEMSRHYPELMEELNQRLELLEYQSLSPGMLSALRQIKKKIKVLRKSCYRM